MGWLFEVRTDLLLKTWPLSDAQVVLTGVKGSAGFHAWMSADRFTASATSAGAGSIACSPSGDFGFGIGLGFWFWE